VFAPDVVASVKNTKAVSEEKHTLIKAGDGFQFPQISIESVVSSNTPILAGLGVVASVRKP
jgi:hypothetical protein